MMNEEGGEEEGGGGLEIGGDERLSLSKRADSTSSEGQFFQRAKWSCLRCEADSLCVWEISR